MVPFEALRIDLHSDPENELVGFRLHHRDHLARRHDIALVDEELRDAARELRVGFEPTIAHSRCGAVAAFDDADARPTADEQYQTMSVTRSLRRCGYGACSMTASARRPDRRFAFSARTSKMRWGCVAMPGLFKT